MFKATFLLAVAFGASTIIRAQAAPAPAKPTPDLLVFTNGDQLTGKVERATGGNVVFKSDMAGEITVGFDKIKELRSGSGASQFALLRKGQTPKQMMHAPEGTLGYADGTVTIAPQDAEPLTANPTDVAYLIDKSTYDKSVAHRVGPFEGWNGTITGGASVVRSSSNGTTLTAAANLVRALPLVPYLPARNRTSINVAESYGTLTIVAPPPVQPTVKTSIFHADAERDEYFSPRVYALGEVAFDHNFSQSLQLQQVYGGGVGWTAIKSAKQELDLKGDVHYEHQEFLVAPLPATPTPLQPPVSLFGSTFGETYIRNLPRKIVFTEVGTYLPAWNMITDYSANITATLSMPVFKRLSATISTTDNYLNNAPVGTNKNSYQFVTGVTYVLR